MPHRFVRCSVFCVQKTLAGRAGFRTLKSDANLLDELLQNGAAFIVVDSVVHIRPCKKFIITTRTRQGRSKPFLEREGFGFFVFGGVPRRTTKASAAHGRAASAQAQCTADAYFLCRALSPDGRVRVSAAF